jgi:hypothetical protein
MSWATKTQTQTPQPIRYRTTGFDYQDPADMLRSSSRADVSGKQRPKRAPATKSTPPTQPVGGVAMSMTRSGLHRLCTKCSQVSKHSPTLSPFRIEGAHCSAASSDQK